jgi:hypothetical protein
MFRAKHGGELFLEEPDFVAQDEELRLHYFGDGGHDFFADGGELGFEVEEVAERRRRNRGVFIWRGWAWRGLASILEFGENSHNHWGTDAEERCNLQI